MPEAIELRGLTRWYGKRRGVIDLEADVHEGEVFGFLGPNGAGKTTTIRAPAVHRRLAHLGSDPGYLGDLDSASLLDHLGALRGLKKGA